MLLLVNKSNVRSGNRAVVLAESIVRRKWSVSFRKFRVGIVALKSIQNIAMLVQSVRGILVLVDSHLEEPLSRTEEFYIEAIVDRIFKLFFDGIVASNVEHVVDKEEEAEPLIVFVVSDKIGWFGRGLDKSLGVEPFREFDVTKEDTTSSSL